MQDRSGDWIRQAEADLVHAQKACHSGSYEWACFAAHQAAEKAVKALHLRLGQEAQGNMVRSLLEELPEGVSVSRQLLEKARVLDNFYIPTRYPNAHPSGAPADHYGSLQSDQGISYACAIIEFCRSQMA